MSLVTQISSALTTLGTAIKTLGGRVGANVDLTTTAKSTIVAAINEVKASTAAAGAQIDDVTPSTTAVYSSTKTNAAIAAANAALINGAPAAFDTLKEIADYIATDQTGAAAVNTALSNRVRFDAVQTLTAPQQAQAQANIVVYSKAEIGDPATDFVAVVNAALA